jgi:hypothetical protein
MSDRLDALRHLVEVSSLSGNLDRRLVRAQHKAVGRAQSPRRQRSPSQSAHAILGNFPHNVRDGDTLHEELAWGLRRVDSH